MTKKIVLSTLTALTLLFIGCNNIDPVVQPEPTVTLDDEVNDFVWKAMNHWYFWQSDVVNLDDSKDDEIDAYYTFLNGFSESKDLFESLLNSSADDFSWYIPDLEAQLNEFRGISVTYGIELPRTVVSYDANNNIVIFVAYVVPGSPADLAGIERGDLIYKVDGTVLNTTNFSLLNGIIFPEGSISLGIARFENGDLVPKGNDVSLNTIEVTENPVHFSSIIEEGGKKIGYLVYNGFRRTYHNELNGVFSTFKAQNIDELVLDLRYNGGGSVLTSAYLSSMIEGSKANGTTFALLTYNAKRNAQNGITFPFSDNAILFNKETGLSENITIPISRLANLSRIYVLTSDKTASASEMIINGLRPSMEVITVGTTTVGKNEGSNTLVDAPATNNDQIFTNVEGRNPNHEVALQPITFQIFNSLNQSNYTEGFLADIEVDEIDFTANILPFGDTNEVLLRTAINNILGISTRSSQLTPKLQVYKYGKLAKKKFSEEMYILPGEEILRK